MSTARVQDIIDLILKSLEGQNGASLVSFARVIEHDIENDFDTRLVQGFYHLLELEHLGAWLFGMSVAAMRCKEGQRVVAPVIGPLWRIAVHVQDRKLMDRHQLNRSNAKTLQIRYFLDYPQIGSRMLNLRGLALRKSFHVHFVDDAIAERAAHMAIAFPVKCIIDDDAFRWSDNAVCRMLATSGQRLGVRVYKPSVAVKPLTRFWIEWPIGLKMV